MSWFVPTRSPLFYWQFPPIRDAGLPSRGHSFLMQKRFKNHTETYVHICASNGYPSRKAFVRVRHNLTHLMKLNFCIDFLTGSSIAQITIVVLFHFYEELITRHADYVVKFVVYKCKLGIFVMFVIFPLQTIFYTLRVVWIWLFPSRCVYIQFIRMCRLYTTNRN